MTQDDTDSDFPGDRIAKVLSRAGVASRRDAERMIMEGRVSVNGQVVETPALNVGPGDRISVDGSEIDPPDPVRIWLYHKPAGLVTTAKDEEGRETIFDHMPEGLPYVMPVGRLDLTSEGLLLLTNDGGVKRRLELPSTAWLRRYRVRVNGEPGEAALAAMRAGVTVDGVAYAPMEVRLDRQQGANAWLTVGLREGRNREIRRVMEHLGLRVNRLIRISYGPFQLGELAPGAVEEVRPRVVRDQLGLDARDEAPPARPAGPGRERLSADAGRTGKVRVLRKRRPEADRGADARPAGARAPGAAGPGGKPAPAGRRAERGPSRKAAGDRTARPGEGPPSRDKPARPAHHRDRAGAPKSGDKPHHRSRDDRADARPARSGFAAKSGSHPARGNDGRPARENRTERPDGRDAAGDRPARSSQRRDGGSGPHQKAGAPGRGRQDRTDARPARSERADARPARAEGGGSGHAGKPWKGRAPEGARVTSGDRKGVGGPRKPGHGAPSRNGPPGRGAAPRGGKPRNPGPSKKR